MFLVDTNVLSEARRGAEPAVAALTRAGSNALFLSVITLGEIEKGVTKKEPRDRDGAAKLAAWIQTTRRHFSSRVLPVSDEIATEWGRIAAMRTRSDADGLIAATAIVHGLVLMTRNVSDFADTRAVLLNPWDAA